VIGGPNQNLFLFDLNNKEGIFQTIILPSGCNSILKLKFSAQSHLYFIGTNDRLYCLDILKGYKSILEHNLPRNEAPLDFDIDLAE
jgi:hypothetical protein